MKKFNYDKIQNRIDKLNQKRNEHGHFIGTSQELDQLMDLSVYNRQDLGHALCLDFKTNVTRKVTTFKHDDIGFGITHYFLVIEGNPCTFEITNIEDLSDMHIYLKAAGILKSLYNNMERKYNVVCKDRAGCECWFIKEQVA